MATNVISIRTPGYVLSEMSTVDVALKSLIKDVTDSGAPDAFRRGLAEFAQEWMTFYNEHASGFGAWWSRGTTPVYDKVVDFQRRLREWQEKYRGIGGALTQPSLTPAGTPAMPRWLVWGAIGAGVLGGGYLLMTLARKASPQSIAMRRLQALRERRP